MYCVGMEHCGGLDIPEGITLVAILDADKEGFLSFRDFH